MQTEEDKHSGKVKQVLIISLFFLFLANHKAFFSLFFFLEIKKTKVFDGTGGRLTV